MNILPYLVCIEAKHNHHFWAIFINNDDRYCYCNETNQFPQVLIKSRYDEIIKLIQ